MQHATAPKLAQLMGLVAQEVKFRKRVGTKGLERAIANDILAEIETPNLDRQLAILRRRAATRRRQAAVKAGAVGRGST
jgi:hypothetical protein